MPDNMSLPVMPAMPLNDAEINEQLKAVNERFKKMKDHIDEIKQETPLNSIPKEAKTIFAVGYLNNGQFHNLEYFLTNAPEVVQKYVDSIMAAEEFEPLILQNVITPLGSDRISYSRVTIMDVANIVNYTVLGLK